MKKPEVIEIDISELDKVNEQSFLDECAMRSMQGYIASHPGNEYPNPEIISEKSYEMANYMLKKRKELKNEQDDKKS